MKVEHPLTDPEDVAQLKAAILNQWQALPPEEQLALLTEQLKTVMDTEVGAGLREALRTEEVEPDPLHTIYPVTGFSRADLQKHLRFRKRDVQQLDDADMREIAGRLEAHYVELSFWGDLDYVARHVLEHKQKLSARK
jgi:hypothetical protein